jgi:hypothetical protein
MGVNKALTRKEADIIQEYNTVFCKVHPKKSTKSEVPFVVTDTKYTGKIAEVIVRE